MTNLHDVRVEIVFASGHPEPLDSARDRPRRGTATGHIFVGPSTSLGVTGDVGGEKAGFRSFACVAHEKFAKAAVVEHHDDAVLVDVVTRVGEKWKLRCEDVERYAVSGTPTHTAPCKSDWHSVGRRRRHRIAIRTPAIRLARIEDHPDGHRINNWRRATYMIAVGVSYAGASDVEAVLHRLFETEIVTG